MMAFFFTMPIKRMMPIKAIMLNSVLNSSNASNAPTPADGNVDRIVNRMDVALVEDAEHDIDGDQRRQNKPSAGFQARTGRPSPFPERCLARSSGRPISCMAFSIAATASPSDTPGADRKDSVTPGN